MGMLDRLWHNPDDDEDDEDEHSCAEHWAIVERGNYVSAPGQGVQFKGDKLVFPIVQKVMLECQECERTKQARDNRTYKEKVIDIDREREAAHPDGETIEMNFGMGGTAWVEADTIDDHTDGP